jgi:hypothetical protein
MVRTVSTLTESLGKPKEGPSEGQSALKAKGVDPHVFLIAHQLHHQQRSVLITRKLILIV